MGAERNKALAVELITAIGEGDFGVMERLLHDDAQWWVIGTTTASGTKNKARNIKMVKAARGFGEGGFNFRISETTAEDDRVWLEVTGSLKLKSGAIYANTYAFKLTFRDGKIIEGREFLDTALVDRLFGTRESHGQPSMS